jgi:hypothetical protein
VGVDVGCCQEEKERERARACVRACERARERGSVSVFFFHRLLVERASLECNSKERSCRERARARECARTHTRESESARAREMA